MKKIKNIEKTAERLIKAVRDKEKIILYGDADVDGTASVIILEETIKRLGGKVSQVYFPDREKEGYGLNFKALDFLSKKTGGNAILIIMDSGISNFKEADYARELGLELIIIDHHQPLNRLPNAAIIVNPKQKKDNYPFKDFSNTGIIFKFSEELLGNKMEEHIKNNF